MKTRLYTTALLIAATLSANAQNTPVSQMEKLDRGVIALTSSSGKGNFVSWRFLGTDDENTTTFELLRNGNRVKTDLYATCYNDASGTNTSTYQVVTMVNGEPVDTTVAITPWGNVYKTINLDQPATGAQGGTYSPNDCSVGDVDGDGEYEIFVKWDPSTSKDNSQNGMTDNVFIDCYKLDGTKLWRIDLGVNIRAGAHYTQYMVYDFDKDGKAEMICKTAPGSKDGKGVYVNQAATDATIKAADNSKDYRNSNGRVNGGHEYLTVFDGQTGAAIHTIAYYPNRNATATLSDAAGTYNWGANKNDKGDYGNRGERYLAGVAYLDGPEQKPSGIFCRGYYTYAHVWAVDFDGTTLSPRWLHSATGTALYSLKTWDATGNVTTKTVTDNKPTSGKGSGTMYGNGNHNMSIADVDGDGCDEIIWGSSACNNDGMLLYSTGFGHGDAIHLADHCPDRPGLEVFQIHEESPYGWDLHDAATGEVLYSATGSADNGRGIAGNFDSSVRGSLFWSSNDGSARSTVSGEVVSEKHGSSNFRIFWDGDLYEELLDGNKLDKWNGNGTSRLVTFYDLGPGSTCNSTKNTPNLQADIFGDWREEVILHNGSNQLAIYSTNILTNCRIPTLMHDHTYRMGICWQNTAYNQPPHLGYYLPDAMQPQIINAQQHDIKAQVNTEMNFICDTKYVTKILLLASFTPDSTRKSYVAPDGFEKPVFDTGTKTITLKGTPTELGTYRFALKLTGPGNVTVNDTLVVNVGTEPVGIEEITSSHDQQPRVIYDAAGRVLSNQLLSTLPKGLYIIREGARSKKVIKK